MPTKFTHTAGGFAFVSSLLWIAALGVFALGDRVADDWDLPVYLVWAALITLAGASLMVTAVGLRELYPRRRGWALSGIIILGVGVAIGGLMTWAVPLWMAVEGIGLLILVAACRPITLGSAVLGIGMPLGVAVFFVLDALQVGAVDQYGDYPAAWQGGLATGALIVAAGLIGIGRQLRSSLLETSVDEPVTA